MNTDHLHNFKPTVDFLKEEVISGYLVTEKRKEIWAVELDLFLEFEKICKKYNLKYWAFGGTLLGAARHSGFIPWDDDIDILMPRKDYDKLKQVGPKEFISPYFFQNPITENGRYYNCHCQIRNSMTTGIISGTKNLDINKGMFLDVFVLDKIPKKIVPLHYIISRKTHRLMLKLGFGNVALYNYWEIHERIYRNVPFVHTLIQTMTLGRKYHLYDERIWEGTTLLPFCGYYIMAPSHFNELLSLWYGDWRIPRQVSSVHGEILALPDIPYTEI